MEDPTPNTPTLPRRQKAQSLEDIILQLRPITKVSYEPFEVNLDRQQEHFYLLFFLKNHTHSTISVCFSPTTFSDYYYEYKSIRKHTKTTYSGGKDARIDRFTCGGAIMFVGAII
jgi:hypothetical protein